MKEIEFIRREGWFIIKNYWSISLSVIAILIPSFLISVINLKNFQSSIPGMRNLVIEMTLASQIMPIAMFSAFLIASVVNEEKKDRIFEQIFMVPLSPLKMVLYHFIALTTLMMLSIGIGYIIITAVMIIIMGSAYIPYISILRGFISSLLLALPLCYVILLNSMLMPSKYSSLLFMFLLLMALLPMQGVFSMFGTGLGLLETIILSVIIASIVLIVISIAETIILKDKVVELTITNQ